MNDISPHVRLFREHQPLLKGIAYRMLGSMSDAEDIVQDAFLRWRKVPLKQVDSAKAYLASIVTRLCIDRQRRAKVEQLLYTGPWLPEPLDENSVSAITPDDVIETSEHISMAFMMMLQSLQPQERAVFILREAFDLSHDEISSMLDIRAAHSRQLLRRARQKIEPDGAQPLQADEAEDLMGRFLEAAQSGDMTQLTAMMHEDIVAYSDGGGRVSAAIIPLEGQNRVATVLTHLIQHKMQHLNASFHRVNGDMSLVLRDGDSIDSTHSITLKNGLIYRIYTMRNPEKLQFVS